MGVRWLGLVVSGLLAWPCGSLAEEAVAAGASEPASAAAEAAPETPATPPRAVSIGDRAVPFREVPAALTILPGELVQRLDVDSLYDLSVVAPALVVHEGRAHLRAAGEGGDTAAVALVNGQPFSAGLDSSFAWFDVAEVAVLRGPTLVGPGSGSEGALDLTWNAPRATQAVFGDATAGSDQWGRLRAGVNVAPLGEGDERLTARAALQGEWRGGSSPSTGREVDDLGGRLSLRSVPRAGTELTLRGQLLHSDLERSSPGFISNVRGFDGEAAQALGEVRGLGSLSLRLRGGWQETELDAPSEEIASDHTSGDLRAESRGGRFADLALGFFYERREDESGVLAPPSVFEQHAPYLSVDLRPFAEVGIAPLAALDFFGGVRWQDESLDTAFFGIEREEWIWELGARWRPQPGHVLWVRYGDEGLVAQHAWELGWRGGMWRERAEASVVMFRASSMRVRELCLLPSLGGCLLEIDGPDGTRRWGFEAEAALRPREGARIAASVSRLDGEYEALGAFFPAAISNAPTWQVRLLAEHRFSLGARGALTPLAAFVWIDDHDLTLSGRTRDTRRTDLRLRWDAPSARYWAEGFAENLEDRDWAPSFGLEDNTPRGRVLGVRVGFALARAER